MKKLNPFMDSDGILRDGGRLNQAPIDVAERNPIITARDVRQENIIVHRFP